MEGWGMAAKLRPGYRTLLRPAGHRQDHDRLPPGKSTGREVYKVDISLIVSGTSARRKRTWARSSIRQSTAGGILFSTRPTSVR